jgi:hypothetical protein
MSKVWLYIGNKTFALYSAKELTESVKLSLRHSNKKMIEAAAVKSVTSLIAAKDGPKALDEFLAISIDRANDYIEMNKPLTGQTLISLGTVAFIGYGLFSVWAHFGLLWAIIALPLAMVTFVLACFLLLLPLMILTAILWGAIFVFSPEVSREILSV